jgi:uncharacterized protein YjiS (DUF1127 family)
MGTAINRPAEVIFRAGSRNLGSHAIASFAAKVRDGAKWAVSSPLASLLAIMREAQVVVSTWSERARARRSLASMSERELHDIGTGWSEIAHEVNKPFWRK